MVILAHLWFWHSEDWGRRLQLETSLSYTAKSCLRRTKQKAFSFFPTSLPHHHPSRVLPCGFPTRSSYVSTQVPSSQTDTHHVQLQYTFTPNFHYMVLHTYNLSIQDVKAGSWGPGQQQQKNWTQILVEQGRIKVVSLCSIMESHDWLISYVERHLKVMASEMRFYISTITLPFELYELQRAHLILKNLRNLFT